jgi:TolB-like protein/lipopolysaccharide biosynthesis regulator YciM
MKHCPECNKNYADPTLSFCLQDGAPLIFGPAVQEPSTAILSGDFPSESPTRQIDPHTTSPTESFVVRDSKKTALPRGKLALLIGGVALVLAIGSFAAYRFSVSNGSNQIESVAVLPFENGSGDPNLDYLSDGLSESLIDKLSQLPQLKVISRNSSFKYRGPDVDVKDAAAKLGVRAVVSGKVIRVADNLSIRVEMVDARDDRQIWSEQFNRKAADILALQQEIAQTASDKLRLKLTGAQEQRVPGTGTGNPQAYEALLKARFFRNKGGRENLLKALDSYIQATTIDPSYALAYAETADVYAVLVNNSVIDPKEGTPKAEAAAQKAVELDANLAEAHTSLGYIKMNAWEWDAARREFLRALELNPNSSRAHDLYSGYLSYNLKHEEAIVEAKKAVELDPLALGGQMGLAGTLLAAQKYDEAIDTLNKVKQLEPNYAATYINLGYTYAARNMHPEAIAAYRECVRINGESSSSSVYLAASMARSGDRAGALTILKKLETTKEYVSPGELAIVYTALGDKEKALDTLDRAFQEHDLQLKYLNIETGYDDLRSEPRFQELVKKVGLPL